MLLRIFLVLLTGGLTSAPGVSHSQMSVLEMGNARACIDSTGFEGAILIYDLGVGSYVAGHTDRVDRRLIPASTFKIFNSLVALEVGVVSDMSTVIEWDRIIRKRTELNRNLDLQSAFHLSAVPHFQELARRVGAERMQYYVDAVGYGNLVISGGIDEFWLTGGLRISPREQVEFLARLYRGELPFSSKVMGIVREMMITERATDFTICGKTGWALLDGNENVGWWVGWIESKSGTHIFATVLESTTPGSTFGPARKAVTRKVFEQLGVLRTAH